MLPSEVRYLPDLPRLPNFKTNFTALHALDSASQPAISISPDPPSSEPSDPSIDDAVRRAWTDILGSQASDTAFDQAGGDSLKLLQLSLHLEQSLGCRLPLDLFDLEISPAMLGRRLTDFRSSRQRHAGEDLPLVVLCPGMGGDEPRLAAFRRALRHRVRFLVIEYPGLETPARRLGRLDALVDDALAQVALATSDSRSHARKPISTGRKPPRPALEDGGAIRIDVQQRRSLVDGISGDGPTDPFRPVRRLVATGEPDGVRPGRPGGDPD